jgi:hypothetical protein
MIRMRQRKTQVCVTTYVLCRRDSCRVHFLWPAKSEEANVVLEVLQEKVLLQLEDCRVVSYDPYD